MLNFISACDPPSAVGSVAVLLACFLTVFGPSFTVINPWASPAVGTGVVVIVTAATVLGRAPVGRVGRDRAFRRIELPGVAVVEYRLRRS